MLNIFSITKKHFRMSLFIIVFFGLFFIFSSTYAQGGLQEQIREQTQAGAKGSGFGEAIDPRVTVALTIRLFLGFVGSIFLILLILGSFWYITARGRPEKIEKATKTIRGAIIGLLIVVMSYAITYFVSREVQKSIQNQNPYVECIELGTC